MCDCFDILSIVCSLPDDIKHLITGNCCCELTLYINKIGSIPLIYGFYTDMYELVNIQIINIILKPFMV